MARSLSFKASDAASPGISLGSEVIYFMALKVCPGAVVAVIKVTVGVVLSISVVSSLGYAAFVSSETMFSRLKFVIHIYRALIVKEVLVISKPPVCRHFKSATIECLTIYL